jgi:molybdopterin-guanine dinucleotide biosynthesis protein B
MNAALAPTGGFGPFWGRPAGRDIAHLPARKLADYTAFPFDERREIDRRIPSAQPVWKLFTTGSVGSQSLMGLPLVHRLSQAGAAVWPFDAADARVVLAEIYPSLLAGAVAQQGGIKDEAQVRLLASALWRLVQGGGLPALLRVPDGPARTEEGWILGAGHTATLEAAL